MRSVNAMAVKARGFSLIELLVVLVIIGLLAGLIVPNIMGRTGQAQADAAKAQIQRLSMAVETYFLDNGTPPQRLEDLVRRPSNAPNWNGPYVQESLMTDPWGNEWEYRYPGQHGEFDIRSFGANGSPGGEGRNAEVTSW